LLIFTHHFITHLNFTGIAASNTASNDATNWVTYSICDTNLWYSHAHFVLRIDEKSNLSDRL